MTDQDKIKAEAQRIMDMFMPYAQSTDFDQSMGEFYTNNLLWSNNANQCAIKHVEGLIPELLEARRMGGSIIGQRYSYLTNRINELTTILNELKQFKP